MENSQKRSSIVFYLNGQRTEVSGADALQPFAHFLRYKLDKPGTKVVCSEGDCGACTVLVASYRGGRIQKFQSINACIAPVFSLDLSHVVTVEGLAGAEQLSAVQKCFVENGGAQCGYCTPGFVCAVTELAENCLQEKTAITEKKARNYLTGNLCRCTGYEPILKAATSISLSDVKSLNRFVTNESLNEFKKLSKSVHITGSGFELSLPVTVSEAVALKTADTRLVAGATDLGVLINKDKMTLTKALSLMHVEELQKVEMTATSCKVGARATLTDLEKALEEKCPEFSNLLHVFASPQIKNLGTIVGNVVNASPIADTIPALMVLNSFVVAQSSTGVRRIAITEFYKGYKQLDLRSDEIVTGVEFEIPAKDEVFKLYKVAPRKDLDISVVTFAGVFKLSGKKITAARIAFGGVGPVVIRMKKLEALFTGQDFSADVFEKLSHEVEKEITPLSDLRGSREFRLKLGENLLKKCFHEVSSERGL